MSWLSLAVGGACAPARVERPSAPQTPDASGSDARASEAREPDASIRDSQGPTEPHAPASDAAALARVDAQPLPPAPGTAACERGSFCDGFETSASGTEPDPAIWTVVSPTCSKSGRVSIDSTHRHGGKSALKVVAGGGYCDHVFVATTKLPEAGKPLYGRFFLWLSEALGEGHATFLALKDTNDGGDLRMGGQKRVLMWNRQSDDATLPALSPTGMAKSARLAPETWACLEFLVDGDNATLRTWLDGVELQGLVADGQPTPDVDDQWLRKRGWRPAVVDVKLGWEAYAGQAMTLWIDDVALGDRRIGCE